jgi:hypothetical protein
MSWHFEEPAVLGPMAMRTVWGGPLAHEVGCFSLVSLMLGLARLLASRFRAIRANFAHEPSEALEVVDEV